MQLMTFNFSETHLLTEQAREKKTRLRAILFFVLQFALFLFAKILPLERDIPWYYYVVLLAITVVTSFWIVSSRKKDIARLKTYQIQLSDNHISDLYRGKYIRSIHYSLIDDFSTQGDVLILKTKSPNKGVHHFNLKIEDRETLLSALNNKLLSDD